MILSISEILDTSESQYEVIYETFLDYKKSYAPRAFFQENASSDREVIYYTKSMLILDYIGFRFCL